MKKLATPLMLLICLAAIFFLQMGFIFILLALLPSLVAFYGDIEKGRPTFITVFCCNLAATLPWLVPIFKTTTRARQLEVSGLLATPKVWMIIYLGAAGGWLLIFLCRYIANFVVTIEFDYRASSLEKTQKKLVEEWSSEITK